MKLIEPPPDLASHDERWAAGSPWYQRAYFEDRVSQELYRSRRYDTDTTLVVVHIPAVSRRAARALYTFVATQLRTIDCAGLMGTGDYGICLPHTSKSGGEIVALRIRAFMEEYQPLVGVASYGDDGTEFDSLFEAAEAAAA
jgi:GGDEF domain-containing protein